jgi:hypothetical protein
MGKFKEFFTKSDTEENLDRNKERSSGFKKHFEGDKQIKDMEEEIDRDTDEIKAEKAKKSAGRLEKMAKVDKEFNNNEDDGRPAFMKVK